MNTLTKISRYFYWNALSRPFVHFILRRSYNFQLTPESDKFPKPPFVVVANHGTFFDPWLVGVYSSYPLIYMVNDDGFRGKNLSSWYLRKIGAIPKKKGASDYKAIKNVISQLNQKCPVFIFPEGQTTWDGETQPLYRGLEKILKKVICPLVMVKLKGNFLAKPWWADSLRKGKISITMKVISPAQIDNMSSDDIFDTLKKYIYQNDIKDSRNKEINFTGNCCAEGLELFVWKCIHCSCEDTLFTHGNTITCLNCNNTWEIDANCKISSKISSNKIEDLWDWSAMHKREVLNRISEKPDLLTKTDNVIMSVENKNREFQTVCSGTLKLNSETLSFISVDAQYNWSVNKINDYVIQKKNIFEIRSDNQTYRFIFDKKSPMKWVFYFRYLNNFEQCEKQGYY